MRSFFLSTIMLLAVATALIAQNDPGQIPDLENPVPVPNVQVVTGTYLTADDVDYRIIDNRVKVFAVGLDAEQKQVARLKTKYNEGWVFVYDQAKPYPPKISLLPAPVEIAKPGIYDVQVLPIVDGKGIPSVFIEGIKVGKILEPEPDGPDNPVPPPSNDYENLANLSKDLAILVEDTEHARKYLSELKKVKFEGTLDSAKRSIGMARVNASRGGVRGRWYKFFQPLDDEISKATTVKEYELMWRAVIRGLESYLSSSTSSSRKSLQIPATLPILYSSEPAKLPVLVNPNCTNGCPPPLR